MIKIANGQFWVHDQDEALDFYTRKLGFELRQDVTLAELGNFRWLTVGPPNQPDVAIVLMAIPGPPVMDASTADQVRELMAKGFAGTVFLTDALSQAGYFLGVPIYTLPFNLVALGTVYALGVSQFPGMSRQLDATPEETAEDVLWRRTKCGLHMTQPQRDAVAEFMKAPR